MDLKKKIKRKRKAMGNNGNEEATVIIIFVRIRLFNSKGCVSTEFVAEYYIRKQFLLKNCVFAK
jgi:hypothetical protein